MASESIANEAEGRMGHWLKAVTRAMGYWLGSGFAQNFTQIACMRETHLVFQT